MININGLALSMIEIPIGNTYQATTSSIFVAIPIEMI